MNKFVLSKLIGKNFVESIMRVTPAVVVSDAKQVSKLENGEPVFEFTVSKINYHEKHSHNPLRQPRDVNTMFRGVPNFDFNVLYMQPVIKFIESQEIMLTMTQIVDTFEIIKESNLLTRCRFTIGNAYEDSEYDASYIYRLHDSIVDNYDMLIKAYLHYAFTKEGINGKGVYKYSSYGIGLDYDKFKDDIQGIRDVRSSIRKVIGASIIKDKIIIDDSESKINLSIDIDVDVLMFVASAEFRYNLIEGCFETWVDGVEEPQTSESDSESENPIGNGSDSDSNSSEEPATSDSDSEEIKTPEQSESDSTSEPEVTEPPVESESDSESEKEPEVVEPPIESESDSDSDTTNIPETSESDSSETPTQSESDSESEKEPEVIEQPVESESDSTKAPETSESDSTSESTQTPDSSDGTTEDNEVPSESDSTELAAP